jgi:hypothetical protein
MSTPLPSDLHCTASGTLERPDAAVRTKAPMSSARGAAGKARSGKKAQIGNRQVADGAL